LIFIVANRLVCYHGTLLLREIMTEKLDPKELVTFKELLISNSIQIEALTQLWLKKGF